MRGRHVFLCAGDAPVLSDGDGPDAPARSGKGTLCREPRRCWLLATCYASGRRVLGSGIASRQRKRWCDRDGSGDPPRGMRPWRHGCGRPLSRSRQPMPTIAGQDSANVWGRCLLRGGTQDNMCPCSRSSTRHHIWPSLSLRLQLGCKRAMHSGLISYKFRTFLVLMALRYPVDSVQFGHGAT